MKMSKISRRRSRLRSGVRARLRYKKIIAVSSGIFAVVSVLFFIYFGSHTEDARAAINGDFRTISSGSWNTIGIWQRYNGVSWVAATLAPTSANNIIEIQSGHTVSVVTNVTADQIIVVAGGTLNITSNTFTVNKGAGTDIQVDGTLTVSSTIVLNSNTRIDVNSNLIFKAGSVLTRNSGSVIYIYGRIKNEGGTIPTVASFWYVQTGGTYEHAINGGTIPSAAWFTNSTLEITGCTTASPSAINQSFQNFTWNSPSQSTDVNFGGSLTTVNGTFNLKNTGSASIFLDQQGNGNTLNINRDFNIIGGKIYLCVNGSTTLNISGNLNVSGGYFAFNQSGGTAYGNSSAIVSVTGDVNVTGGTVDLTQCSINNSTNGTGQLFLKGNLNVANTGVITETSSASRGQIIFNGTLANQTTDVGTNITNQIDYFVLTGAVLQMADRILPGDGDFTLNAGGGLQIGSAEGISSTGSSGNVQCTGTRSYSTSADYTYNGVVTQISGNGLPSQVRNLTLNNVSNCTLSYSTSVSQTLSFMSGLWIASNDTLTLGISTTTLGTLSRISGHVVGSFRRWVANSIASNIYFPVGTMTNYNGANFSFTTAPSSGGSITCNFINSGYIATLGLPILDAGDLCSNIGFGYWSLGGANGFSGGTWSVNLMANGFPAIFDYTTLHAIRRTNPSTAWLINGTHTAGTGSNSAPVANRNGMMLLGNYGITSGASNPLPIELIFFKAKASNNSVDLNWQTASEVNNDYFTLERSRNGSDFTSIGTVQGAGNSTHALNYSSTDYSPPKGIAYYRLRQTDYDGKTTTSEVQKVNLTDDGMDHAISIETLGPNPFGDEFKFTYYTDHTGDISIEIFNIEGKIFYKAYQLSTEGMNQFTFTDGSRLLEKEYILRISHSGGAAVKRLIKK